MRQEEEHMLSIPKPGKIREVWEELSHVRVRSEALATLFGLGLWAEHATHER